MNFFKVIGLMVWKDGLSELRSRENIASMFFFALLILFIFNFSLPLDQRVAQTLAPGLIWIAFGFTGVIGLGRSFLAERDNDCLEALLSAPVPKGALYLGKLLGNFLFMLAAEVLLFPLLVLFLNLDMRGNPALLLLVFVLGTLGLAALGTLFSAMMVQVRAREVMFPILMLPLAAPVMIAAVQATAGILHGNPWAQHAGWISLLAVFDLIFVVIAFWTFEFILEG